MKILITGANGQLGTSIQSLSLWYPEFEFIFTDVEQLDITKLEQVKEFFGLHKPDYCVNAAAYTQVDKAEEDIDLNNLINITGSKNLAIASRQQNSKLIHISSDYVYNNDSKDIMDEDSPTLPKGVYAESKQKGEIEVQNETGQYYIIRTSWLYSEYGNNFVKTMLRLGNKLESIQVVDDQIGSPTYATDLAEAILQIITLNNDKYGLYNYSNDGFISWYDFAVEIFKKRNINCKVIPIPSADYPTKAPRPLNSRMSKEKISSVFGIKIPGWKSSLEDCLRKIH